MYLRWLMESTELVLFAGDGKGKMATGFAGSGGSL